MSNTVTMAKSAFEANQAILAKLRQENEALKKGNPVSGLAEIQAELDRLKADNAALRAAKASLPARRTSMKVSEKGAVSIYGLGKWPFTQYKENMLKLLDMADSIRKFIVDNDDKLTTKPVKE